MSACDSDWPHWRKSSYSGEAGCVEVASVPHGVLVRDSKNPGGAVLAVTEATWRQFIAGVHRG